MRIRGVTFTTALATASASFLVTGCGGDDDKNASTTAAARTVTTAAAAADGTPEDQARAVTRSFLTALAAGNNGTTAQRAEACAALSDEARTALEAVGTKVSASGCESTLLTIGNLAGAEQWNKAKTMTIDVTTSGDTATASYMAPSDGSPKTIQLVRGGDGWTIASLPE